MKVIDLLKQIKENPELQKQNPQVEKFRKQILNKKSKYIYTSVLGLMIKMRMICCHALLQGYSKDYTSFENFKNDYFAFLGRKKVEREVRFNFFEEWIHRERYPSFKNRKTKFLNKVYSYWDQKFHRISNGYL